MQDNTPLASAEQLSELFHDDVRIVGRLSAASNATFLCEGDAGAQAIYKPVRGERPLWDFPQGTLAAREVLAFDLAKAMGGDFVPPTVWWASGPLGPGSLQAWVDAGITPRVRIEPVNITPRGFVTAFEGVDSNDMPVHLLHQDSRALQHIALFDTVANNADRKIGHLLDTGDRIWAIDHGVCFHEEPKLRTVLWGWAGAQIPDEILPSLMPLSERSHTIYERVSNELGRREAQALFERVTRLIEQPVFPSPNDESPSLPWPLW